MYLECAKRLNVDIANAVVFEDSATPIKQVIEVGCKKIVIDAESEDSKNENNDNSSSGTTKKKKVVQKKSE